MNINTNTLIENLISQNFALNKYKQIIEDVKRVDVSKDKEYQKVYNYFYKVRRNEQWRKVYYNIFEKSKNNTFLKFEDVITELYQKTNRVEASFSSKLLATINPDMPIWDRYILFNLGFELKGKTNEERLCNAITLYDNIIEWYEEFLKTDNAKECLDLFRFTMPNYQWLTDIKIIDYLVCSIRE